MDIAKAFVERVDIAFHGYDQTNQELFEISKVRNFVCELDQQLPFWLFFLSKRHLGLQSPDTGGDVADVVKEVAMLTNQISTSDQSPQGINRRQLILRLACLPVFIALFMFLPAGTWAWPKGWLFVLLVLGVISAVFLVLHRVNPEVIVARSSFHEGTKFWDRILLSFYFPAMAAVLLVAALDDGRFHVSGPVVGLWCRLHFADRRN